ncbi:MAG TPA: RNA-binding protein [Anaerohalosphaeraceae bacterium]|nr:RNA-binding protein [Anaerohalosphaeraceae bacterium]HRT49999.1 RNA-binding protein [Anaerohalosphaeraceae bacterium]HRT85802.1 RNA-binding protein [Anaerohalosphaeraceae bacterium]
MDIYVGNLPFDVTESQLQAAFEAYGQVRFVRIMKDRFSGNPLGFAFVSMPDDNEATRAVAALHRTRIGDRTVIVAQTQRRVERRNTAEVDMEAVV